MPNFHIRAYTVHITNLTEQEIRLSEEDRISHQGLTVQVTVALQLHQGERKKSAEIDEGDSRRQIKNIIH